MKIDPSRRDFLRVTVGAASAAPIAVLTATSLAAALPVPAPAQGRMKKAVLVEMLPQKMSYRDRFQLARDVGFEAVEAQTVKDQREAETIKKAADETKIRIHSVMNMDHWEYPLSSPDPRRWRKALRG
jgi:hexulose-6-phosphate isomerase